MDKGETWNLWHFKFRQKCRCKNVRNHPAWKRNLKVSSRKSKQSVYVYVVPTQHKKRIKLNANPLMQYARIDTALQPLHTCFFVTELIFHTCFLERINVPDTIWKSWTSHILSDKKWVAKSSKKVFTCTYGPQLLTLFLLAVVQWYSYMGWLGQVPVGIGFTLHYVYWQKIGITVVKFTLLVTKPIKKWYGLYEQYFKQ